jgi:crotonobetainyl-CoA:carnitine CoA-transferase CaiB-like acyl-CoA transferase
VSIGDTLAGTFAALGAVMAIHARERTGRGQVVDAAIYESVLAVMEGLIPEYQLGGHIRERSGAILPKVAPSNVYPTRDGKLVVIAGNQDTVFKRLADAMGQPELAAPERFGLHAVRAEKQGELDERVSAWTAALTSRELCAVLEEHAVPFGTLYRAPEMLQDPHFKAREAIVRMLYKGDREIAMQNVFPKLSETPGGVRWIGPELGAHNDEVYGGLLGLSSERIAELAGRGIL